MGSSTASGLFNATAPPTYTTSGAYDCTRFVIPTPFQNPTWSTTCAANSSPSSAASKTSFAENSASSSGRAVSTPPSSSASIRAYSGMLFPEQYASQWPSRPQPHVRRPCGSTTTWPSSPALPSQPSRTSPSTATPAPMPEEMVTYAMSSGVLSAWKRWPMTPATVSLCSQTDSESRRFETGPTRGMVSTESGKFAGPSTVPSARSRGPMLAMPAARTSVGSTPASAQAARSVSRTASATSMPVGPRGVSRRRLPATSPSSPATAARTFVAPRSTPA